MTAHLVAYIQERGCSEEVVSYEIEESLTHAPVVTVRYENGNMRRMTWNYFESIQVIQNQGWA